MVPQLADIHYELKKLSNKEIAEHSKKFYKTGKGQYGDGDLFLGIRVPVLRKLVKKYQSIKILEASQMLKSRYHEERLLAVLFLIELFKNGNDFEQKLIFDLYLKNTKFLNYWILLIFLQETLLVCFCLEETERSFTILLNLETFG